MLSIGHIAAGTVEDRILELQEKKRRVADAAFGGDGSKADTGNKVTMDDLRFLFTAA